MAEKETLVSVKLSAYGRYHYRGRVFERDHVYKVSREVADELLSLTDTMKDSPIFAMDVKKAAPTRHISSSNRRKQKEPEIIDAAPGVPMVTVIDEDDLTPQETSSNEDDESDVIDVHEEDEEEGVSL